MFKDGREHQATETTDAKHTPPELLEAAVEAVRALLYAYGEPPEAASDTNNGHRALRELRAAIAKAEGKR